MIQIHREGRWPILLFFLAIILILVVSRLYIPIAIINMVIELGLVVFLFLVIWFFRIPNRHFVPDGALVLSPADGKIVVIEEAYEPEYFKDKRIQVSIFMSPLNVHSNRYPVSGKVVYKKYHKGKYLVAWHPKSSTDNERSTVVIKTNDGHEILMRQIAGAVARRICTYAQEGDISGQGAEMGFIKFGSRVDLFLPLNTEILCEVGDKSEYNTKQIAKLIS